MGQTANKVIKNTGYLYAKLGITMFISLLITRLILNSLGASDYGIFNIIGGVIAMLGFLNAAMATATQRYMNYCEGNGEKEMQKIIFNTGIVLHFAIAFIASIALLVIGYIFFNGVLNIPQDRVMAAKIVYGSLILSTFFTITSVPYDAAVNAHENMKYYAIVGLIESLLKLGVAIIVVFTSADKLIVYGILMAFIPFITRTILRIYCHRHYEECTVSLREYFKKSTAKEMASFAGWNFLITTAHMICFYGKGIILNHFFGPLLNAAHGITNDLNGKFLTFSTHMQKAINPVIAKSEGAGNRKKMLEASMIGNKWLFFVFAIVIIPAFIESKLLLQLWLKNPPAWTLIFVRIQLLQTLISLTTATFHTSILAEGNIALYSKIASSLNITAIAAIWIAFSLDTSPISLYVISFIINGVIFSITQIYFVKRNCGLSIVAFLKKVAFPCFIVFAIPFFITTIVHMNMEERLSRLLVATAVSTFTFVFSLLIFGLTKKERGILSTLVKKKLA